MCYRVIYCHHQMYCPRETGNISNEKINFTDYFISYYLPKNDKRIYGTRTFRVSLISWVVKYFYQNIVGHERIGVAKM